VATFDLEQLRCGTSEPVMVGASAQPAVNAASMPMVSASVVLVRMGFSWVVVRAVLTPVVLAGGSRLGVVNEGQPRVDSRGTVAQPGDIRATSLTAYEAAG
jgi:hypothetical protein